MSARRTARTTWSRQKVGRIRTCRARQARRSSGARLRRAQESHGITSLCRRRSWKGLKSNHFADLARACAPALQNLLSETTGAPELPLFGEGAREKAEQFYTEDMLARLTQRERKAAEDAAELFRYLERKEDGANFAPAFNVLLGPFRPSRKKHDPGSAAKHGSGGAQRTGPLVRSAHGQHRQARPSPTIRVWRAISNARLSSGMFTGPSAFCGPASISR